MERVIFIIITCFFIAISSIASTKEDSWLIRRAYIELLGKVPTEEEIDWYCSYNKNSYELAIEWIFSQNTIPKSLDKKFYISNNFKYRQKILLSQNELNKIILYIAGNGDKEISTKNVHDSIVKIVEIAQNNESNDLDMIDNMALKLMCRVTSIDEANFLLKNFRKLKETKSEKESLIDIFFQILDFSDVKTK